MRARELLREIKGWPILAGVRGQEGIDEVALVDLIQRLSQLAVDHPEIAELEIYPALAFPGSRCAVDMRMRVEA